MLILHLKFTKWYHKITHPTDIISAPTPPKRGRDKAEATDVTHSKNRGYVRV
jgi:hypothetical protein